MNTAQFDDLATYLPDDRREAIHDAVAPCDPDEYLTAYAAAYGTDDLRQAAELAGVPRPVLVEGFWFLEAAPGETCEECAALEAEPFPGETILLVESIPYPGDFYPLCRACLTCDHDGDDRAVSRAESGYCE